MNGFFQAQLDYKMARIFQNLKPALNMSLLRSWVGNTLVEMRVSTGCVKSQNARASIHRALFLHTRLAQ